MNLLYKDFSYKIIGALYKVYNSLGYGYQEKEYQKAIASEFDSLFIKYEREVYSKLEYKGRYITKFYLDFLVENKIVLEIKVANKVYTKHFNQVLQYLKNNNSNLAIIGVFTPDGILIKRVINQRSAKSV